MTTKTITLDITEAKLPPLVTVKQGDSGRTLEVVVQDGGKDFSAPAGTTATLRIMDTQGRSASVPGTVVAFGGKTTVTVGLTSEALAYAGKYAADIKLSSPDGSESTLNFWLQVQIAPTSDTPIPTPGGGITREELDQALRQNSVVDQTFAASAATAAAAEVEGKIPAVPAWALEPEKPAYTADEVGAASKAYVDEQDDAFFQSLDRANQRITALEQRPSGGGISADEARGIADAQIEANVPSWAREENKPTYTASDVGAIPATDYAVYNDTKAGTAKKALPVSLQHTAVLFGLSKAAGVDLAGRTDVGIGNYPADAKAAIAQMLGVATESQFNESITETRQYAATLVSAAIADVAPLMVQLTALQEDTLGGL